ncbi:hypothetical protein [Streptomyces sp. NPDC058401]|uniref:hypothetical protein n=1 Tax=Streptomyces sp. NPDC058401 TaxID=3346480 RepID=UPI00364604F7
MTWDPAVFGTTAPVGIQEPVPGLRPRHVGGNTVSVVDPATNTVTGSITVGSSPRDIDLGSGAGARSA